MTIRDQNLETTGAVYLTFDNVGVGKIIAEEVMKAKPDGNYAIILGDPGDPNAEGYLVYGCRCTMVSSVEGVKDLDPVYRRDNISGELIDNMTYKDWEEARRGEG